MFKLRTVILCLTLIAVLIAISPLESTAGTSPFQTGPGSAGKISFVSRRDGNYEIYVMNGDGTGQTNVSNHPATDWDPVISPDGTMVAFTSNRTGRYEIYRMNIDGSDVTQLTFGFEHDPGVSTEGIDWSPDGARIAFSFNVNRMPTMFSMNADGSDIVRLTDDRSLAEQFPRYSFDGSKIYLHRSIPGNSFTSQIWVMSPDGSDYTQLTTTGGGNRLPNEIIVDGASMLVTEKRSGLQIHLMNTDGSGEQNLSNNGIWESAPDAAEAIPNEYVFHSLRPGAADFNIYRRNVDGTSFAQLTTDGGSNPRWWGGPTNRAPMADAGLDRTVEYAGPAGTTVTLNGTLSSDPDNDTLTFTWMGPFAEGGGTAHGVMPTVTLPEGIHTVTLTVMDELGLTDTDDVVITVQDTTAPTIHSAAASPNILWPPNHKMVDVVLTVNASDLCSSPTCSIVSVTSNEPENGTGDGDTAPDWVITGELTLELRAERAGGGSGRVYTITIECVDEAGNASRTTTTVTVPKSQGKKK